MQPYFWTCLQRGVRGVDILLNARGCFCGCVNGARKFTPLARVVYLENKVVNTRRMQNLINNALYNWARAIGIGDRRCPTWPFGPCTYVDSRVVFGMLGVYGCASTLAPSKHA
jgi:hypothetical protein